jgi:hypothetical protein
MAMTGDAKKQKIDLNSLFHHGDLLTSAIGYKTVTHTT